MSFDSDNLILRGTPKLDMNKYNNATEIYNDTIYLRMLCVNSIGAKRKFDFFISVINKTPKKNELNLIQE
jgi:hypothetical protein